MHCPHCERTLERALSSLPEVSSVKASHGLSTVVVTGVFTKTLINRMIALIQEADFTPHVAWVEVGCYAFEYALRLEGVIWGEGDSVLMDTQVTSLASIEEAIKTHTASSRSTDALDEPLSTQLKEKTMSSILTFTVPDMNCPHCEKAIQKACGALSGVESVNANATTKIVTITGTHLDEALLRSVITEAGFTVR